MVDLSRCSYMYIYLPAHLYTNISLDTPAVSPALRGQRDVGRMSLWHPALWWDGAQQLLLEPQHCSQRHVVVGKKAVFFFFFLGDSDWCCDIEVENCYLLFHSCKWIEPFNSNKWLNKDYPIRNIGTFKYLRRLFKNWRLVIPLLIQWSHYYKESYPSWPVWFSPIKNAIMIFLYS